MKKTEKADSLTNRWKVINAIYEQSKITASNNYILLNPLTHLEGILLQDIWTILTQLAEDEKVIELGRPSMLLYGVNVPEKAPARHIHESFQIALTDKFKPFYVETSKSFLPSKVTRCENKELSTSEKNTLLRLLGGIVRVKYKYDPCKGGKTPANKIRDDLESVGIKLDDDTIRKWLDKSSEVLPDMPSKEQ